MPNRDKKKVTRRYHKNKHGRVETHSSVGGVGGERELLVRVVVLVQEICGRTRGEKKHRNNNQTILATHELKQFKRK